MISDQRKFNHLNAMGIELWQRKSLNVDSVSTARSIERTDDSNYLPIDLKNLTKQQVFKDVIQSMSVSLDDISLEDDTIKLPRLSWKITKKSEIRIVNNVLLTPSIEMIAISSKFKRLLWQTIQSNY